MGSAGPRPGGPWSFRPTIDAIIGAPNRGRCLAARGAGAGSSGEATRSPLPKRHFMPLNQHSKAITEGDQRAPNRAMLRAVGFGDDDFAKPIVGIANGYSTITPCNAGLDVLAHRAESAIKAGGGMPQMFGTITVSDGISMGTEGMKYSLVSREVIADAIETACGAQSMDGVLAVGGCDKNMPGAMIAMARMNIRRIVATSNRSSLYSSDPLMNRSVSFTTSVKSYLA